MILSIYLYIYYFIYLYKKFKQYEIRNFKRNFKCVINFNFNIDNCLYRNNLNQFTNLKIYNYEN